MSERTLTHAKRICTQLGMGSASSRAPCLLLTLGTMALSVYLYTIVPKGFFPQQDTGRMSGTIQAAEDISFQVIRQKLTEVLNIIKQRSRRRDGDGIHAERQGHEFRPDVHRA